jgi:hypothetical protein
MLKVKKQLSPKNRVSSTFTSDFRKGSPFHSSLGEATIKPMTGQSLLSSYQCDETVLPSDKEERQLSLITYGTRVLMQMNETIF